MRTALQVLKRSPVPSCPSENVPSFYIDGHSVPGSSWIELKAAMDHGGRGRALNKGEARVSVVVQLSNGVPSDDRKIRCGAERLAGAVTDPVHGHRK